MYCVDCGREYNKNEIEQHTIMPMVCGKCNHVYGPITLTLNYIGDIYFAGNKNHLFNVDKPHSCPRCGTHFSSHMFFCGISNDDPDIVKKAKKHNEKNGQLYRLPLIMN